jgi:dienelactone hydrolase
MSSLRRSTIALAVAGVIATTTSSALAARPHLPAVDPTFAPTALAAYAGSQQRAADQVANPAYHLKFQPALRAYLRSQAARQPTPNQVVVDPYLWDWVHDPAHRVSAVSWHNRYGARISGHLWLPPTRFAAPHPTVLLVPGLGTYEGVYWGIAQTVASAGYAVLSFDPQGQGDSDVAPLPKYCHAGAWQQPQEGGIREQGTCAGEYPSSSYPTVVPDPPYPLPPFGSLIAGHDGEIDPKQFASDYVLFRPNFVFGALDAVSWLLSSSDTARASIDPKRIGIMGHSAGSDGAVVTPSVDPTHRFRTAIAFDDYGMPPASWSPTVPTMIQQSEQENFLGPYLARPAADFFPSAQVYSRPTVAGTPAQLVALRSSSHPDWGYVPESLVNPFANISVAQSRYGERLGAYYTVAWLDRWLKGMRGADARLLGCQYDGSVDAASIGVGTYDARTHSNAPYRIKGLPAARLLSPVTSSPYKLRQPSRR